MKKKLTLFLLTLFLFPSFLFADEGMWIPILLKKYNIEDMQKKGFKLTAEDIYSVNKACMKDAVVIFGRGCTGELISDKGLIITNHHCGFGAIQSHSSVEHDYLADGFWAMSQSEELPNESLKVTFLERMEDVTQKVLKGVSENMKEEKRQEIVAKNIKAIKEEVLKDKKHLTAIVKPFYYGNQYFLFVQKIYKDVRLVGAPPSAIGKFGGDTDNWMWPRHTGDFSIFRVYADKNGNPAEYSSDNIPLKPKKHFPISLKGIKKNDFTMVFGYPGRTSEYLPSYAVELITETKNPHNINIRETILDIWKSDMSESQEIRIKYASKQAGLSNGWKKWIGQSRGLRKMKAKTIKRKFEKEFKKWAKEPSRAKKYGKILSQYKKIYKKLAPYELTYSYIDEAVLGIEVVLFASRFEKLVNSKDLKKEEKDKIVASLKKRMKKFFKDYNLETDKKVFAAMMKLYKENVAEEYYPNFIKEIKSKYNGDYQKFVEEVYSKTILTNKKKLTSLLKKPKKLAAKLKKDPAFEIYSQILDLYIKEIASETMASYSKLELLHRKYMKAQMEMQKDKTFYPDANFTLRIAYGKVDGYYPKNGVKYLHYTTLEGIMEKDNPNIYDYKVPEKLKELYSQKDYGQYANKEKELPVAFIATNHTTGGNSGSPVLNGNGELIGVNFDRNWEGTMSDIMYDPSQCRNITLDIRYALFIIDKFAGASHLIKEMTIIK